MLPENLYALPLEQQIGQFLFIGLPGTELDADSRALVEEIKPGGVIIFGRNVAGRNNSARCSTASARSCRRRHCSASTRKVASSIACAGFLLRCRPHARSASTAIWPRHARSEKSRAKSCAC